MIRPAGPRDARFLSDMLRHAYYWHVGEDPDKPVARYVRGWGRPGDVGVVAVEPSGPVGAAWYRRFPEREAGFGFVDERTPELTIAVVPARRGRGLGKELMEALLEQARRDGVERLSLSVEAGSAQEQFYAKFGFERVRDGVMVATLAADVPKA
jgi:GNAT superfamily N-acetyltransferase